MCTLLQLNEAYDSAPCTVSMLGAKAFRFEQDFWMRLALKKSLDSPATLIIRIRIEGRWYETFGECLRIEHSSRDQVILNYN